jgi:acyl-CoA reductase-like NAD-dependent aldehyde dehydrogenase
MAGDENRVVLVHQVLASIPLAFPFSSACAMLPAVPRKEDRLRVQKTYKLFIGGKFVRSESGRVAPAESGGRLIANYPRASRKDFRDAVAAARAAQAGWSKASAYLRGQILYRAAEMLEMRRPELDAELTRAAGRRKGKTSDEASLTIERLVHYAGWTDKFSQIFSAVNPVASAHFNFTLPEPTGVVVVVCPNEPPLLALVSLVAPVILSGNTAVVLASRTQPLAALTFSEIIATSDLPGGVMNLLSGNPLELAPYIASHMDVNAIVDAAGDPKMAAALQEGGGFNLKRYVARSLKAADWRGAAAENPYWILDTVEMKTVWHPIGL